MPELKMDEALLSILGRPCFACVHLAELLRKNGFEIERRAEAEQAHVLLWMLNLYLLHGPNTWQSAAGLQIKHMAQKAKEEDVKHG